MNFEFTFVRKGLGRVKIKAQHFLFLARKPSDVEKSPRHHTLSTQNTGPVSTEVILRLLSSGEVSEHLLKRQICQSDLHQYFVWLNLITDRFLK